MSDKWAAFLVMAVGAIVVLALLPHLGTIIMAGALFAGIIIIAPLYFRFLKAAIKLYAALLILILVVAVIDKIF